MVKTKMAASSVSLRFSCLSSYLASSRHLRHVTNKIIKIECTSLSSVQRRTLHTSEKTNKNDKFNLSNQSSRRRKFRHNEKQKDPMPGKLQTFQLDSLPGDTNSNTSSIRQNAVASTLQQAVASLLEGNDVDTRLLDCSIEITKVKIACDYGHVTFYWRSMDGGESNDNIEKLLQTNESAIRLLLPSYHHLSISPRVIFMRDKQAQYLVDVDILLKKTRLQHNEE